MAQENLRKIQKQIIWRKRLAWGLLFLIFIFVTYLSKLSVTGDFDGKDILRIDTLRVYLDSLKGGHDSLTSVYKYVNSMQFEVIARDYEVKPDSALHDTLASYLTESHYGKTLGDVIDSLIVNCNRMIRFRDITIYHFWNFFYFWYDYALLTIHYLAEHNILRLFTHVLISPVLYFCIFLLACRLVYHILKRYSIKRRTAEYIDQLEPYINDSPPKWDLIKSINVDREKNRIGVGIYRFIKIDGSRELTRHYHEILLLEDEGETEEFMRTTDFITTWILRLGILGTLLGIMLAFYEVAKAVPLIKESLISPAFKIDIREALTGHAVAVITALAAQTVSILFEFFSLNDAGKHLSKDWLLEHSDLFLSNSDNLSEEILDALHTTLRNIRDYGDQFANAKIEINELSEKAKMVFIETGLAADQLKNINVILTDVHESGGLIRKNTGKILSHLHDIRSMVITINLTMRRQLHRLHDLLEMIKTWMKND